MAEPVRSAQFEALEWKLYPSLLTRAKRLARTWGGSAEDGEEIYAQSRFLAFCAYCTGTDSVRDFDRWRSRLLTNCAVSYYRSAQLRRYKPLEEVPAIPSDCNVEAEAIDHYQRERLHAAIADLKPEVRRVFALLLEGLTREEIARVVGRKSITIRAQINRAIPSLRKLLAPECTAVKGDYHDCP